MSQQGFMVCPKCGGSAILTERRPNGNHSCVGCGYTWQNFGPFAQILTNEEVNMFDMGFKTQPVTPPTPEKVLISEIQKMRLEPGDDLIVKLRGVEMDEMASMTSLREMLEEKYPANRVLMFFLPEGTDIDFSIIKKI